MGTPLWTIRIRFGRAGCCHKNPKLVCSWGDEAFWACSTLWLRNLDNKQAGSETPAWILHLAPHESQNINPTEEVQEGGQKVSPNFYAKVWDVNVEYYQLFYALRVLSIPKNQKQMQKTAWKNLFLNYNDMRLKFCRKFRHFKVQ